MHFASEKLPCLALVLFPTDFTDIFLISWIFFLRRGYKENFFNPLISLIPIPK